jgi:transcriptional regulator with XRE-family HTH domain
MTDSPDSMNVIDWVAVGRRMQVARLALGLSPAEAADAWGLALETYLRWEREGPPRWSHLTGKILAFAQKFDVSLDWLLLGDASLVRRHLTKGNVAILPAKGPLARKAAPFEPAC